MTTSILLIEDDKPIAENVALALTREGMSCRHTMLAAEGLELLRVGRYDLAILDVGLPDGNGFDVCRTLRRFSDIPVIFLTARSDEIDRVVGLEIGADDYVLKPFSPRELAARVKTILRRGRAALPSAPATAVDAPPGLIDVDVERARILCRGLPLELSRTELMDGAGLAEASLERAVDTHIKTLRAKLAEAAPGADLIRTHRGLGYSFHPS